MEIPEFNLGEFLVDTSTYFGGLPIYNGVIWLLIFLCLAYIYHRVFQTHRLPLLKLAIVYFLLLIGSFLLLIFQLDAGLPIVYSLIVAGSLILIVRIRYWLQGGNKS